MNTIITIVIMIWGGLAWFLNNVNIEFLNKYLPTQVEDVVDKNTQIDEKMVNKLNDLTMYYNSFYNLPSLSQQNIDRTKKYIIFTLSNNEK